MQNTLPEAFLERLERIIPEEHFKNVRKSFCSPRVVSVRINTLKINKQQLTDILKREQIAFKEVPWAEEALILENVDAENLEKSETVKKNYIYRQGLSSMLPVIILDPKPEDFVLDMCAAPGSKATQMAARMNNQGEIVCLEAVRGRYYKLKNVAELTGAANMTILLKDARKYRAPGKLFDKILVDAPCSSEGRFKEGEPKTFFYWSPRKIKEMAHKQKGLLLAAGRLLRPGGSLVYSTCTFAPEENESVVDWALKKANGALILEGIFINGVDAYPPVSIWGKKGFNDQTARSLRVLPSEMMEGFFIAKLKKIH